MIRSLSFALTLAACALSPGSVRAGITGVATDLQNNTLPGLDIAIYDENDRPLGTFRTGENGEIQISEIPNRPALNTDKPLVIKVVFSGTSRGARRQRVSIQPLNGDKDHVLAVVVPKEEASTKFITPPGGFPQVAGATPTYWAVPCYPTSYPVVATPMRRGHGLFHRR